MKKQEQIISSIALIIFVTGFILEIVNFGRSNVFVSLSALFCLLIGSICLLLVILNNPERFRKKK